MPEEEIIRGPILGWPFPVLNAVLRFLDILRKRRVGVSGSAKLLPRTYSNIETYEIFEDKRGVIKVRVHRKAEKS